jgi:solute carrier family 14 (urea transporter)/urea transporter
MKDSNQEGKREDATVRNVSEFDLQTSERQDDFNSDDLPSPKSPKSPEFGKRASVMSTASVKAHNAKTVGAGGYAPKNRVLVQQLEEPLVPSRDSDVGLRLYSASRWDWFAGTAPNIHLALEGRVVLDFINICLRGVGQVMFQNNPWSGLVILLALAWQSVYCMTMGVLGLVSATGLAFAIGLNKDAIRSGLFGFNGFLVGLALATFDRGCQSAADCQLGLWKFSVIAIPVVLFGMFSTIFAVSLGNFLVPVYSVPAFTLPFNFAALLFLSTALSSQSFPQPFTQDLLPPPGGDEEWAWIEWDALLEALPKGVGQVYLADDTVSGIVIICGIAVCSPASAALAIWGSFLGILTAVLMQCPSDAIYSGLWGHNAVLGMMAIGGTFFYPSRCSFMMGSLCAVMCAFFTGALGSAFTHWVCPLVLSHFALGPWFSPCCKTLLQVFSLCHSTW